MCVRYPRKLSKSRSNHAILCDLKVNPYERHGNFTSPISRPCDRRDRIQINVHRLMSTCVFAFACNYLRDLYRLEIECGSTKVDSSTADRGIRCSGMRMSRRHLRFHFRSSCGGDARSRNLRGRTFVPAIQ